MGFKYDINGKVYDFETQPTDEDIDFVAGQAAEAVPETGMSMSSEDTSAPTAPSIESKLGAQSPELEDVATAVGTLSGMSTPGGSVKGAMDLATDPQKRQAVTNAAVHFAMEPVIEATRSYYDSAGKFMGKVSAVPDLANKMLFFDDENAILSNVSTYFKELASTGKEISEQIPKTDINPVMKFIAQSAGATPVISLEYFIAAKGMGAIPGSATARVPGLAGNTTKFILGKFAGKERAITLEGIMKGMSLMEQSAVVQALDEYNNLEPVKSIAMGTAKGVGIGAAIAVAPAVIGLMAKVAANTGIKAGIGLGKFVTGLPETQLKRILVKAMNNIPGFDVRIFNNKVITKDGVDTTYREISNVLNKELRNTMFDISETTKEGTFVAKQSFSEAMDKLVKVQQKVTKEKTRQWETKVDAKANTVSQIADDLLESLRIQKDALTNGVKKTLDTVYSYGRAYIKLFKGKIFTGNTRTMDVSRQVGAKIEKQAGEIMSRFNPLGFEQTGLKYTKMEASDFKGQFEYINSQMDILQTAIKEKKLTFPMLEQLHANLRQFAEHTGSSNNAIHRQVSQMASELSNMMAPEMFADDMKTLLNTSLHSDIDSLKVATDDYAKRMQVSEKVRSLFFQEKNGEMVLSIDKIKQLLKSKNMMKRPVDRAIVDTEIDMYRTASNQLDDILAGEGFKPMRLFDEITSIVRRQEKSGAILKKTRTILEQQMKDDLAKLKTAQEETIKRTETMQTHEGFIGGKSIRELAHETSEQAKTKINNDRVALNSLKSLLEASRQAASVYGRMNVAGGTPAGSIQRYSGYGGAAIVGFNPAIGVPMLILSGLMSPRVASNLAIKAVKGGRGMNKAIQELLVPLLSKGGTQRILTGNIGRKKP